MSDRAGAYEMIEALYEGLGIPTLSVALAERSVIETVGVDQAGRYARVASIRASGLPMRDVDGEDGTEAMRGMFGAMLSAIVTGEGLGGTPERPTIRGVWSDDEVELNDDVARHIEWMFELFDMPGAAASYLEQMPDAIRADADAQASRSYEAAFEGVVSTF